jgi:trimeric autotransporter adhesin
MTKQKLSLFASVTLLCPGNYRCATHVSKIQVRRREPVMKYFRELLSVLFVLSFCALSNAQTSSIEVPTVVPQLVNYSGKTLDAQDKPVSGIAGITFSIYKDQYEGAPLWMETQNVTADAEGNYTVQLGATKPQGLPLDLFSSGEARWLGVRINNGEEQPRVLLLSVPYALKAADAQTLGGLPASAFALAAPASGGSVAVVSAASSSVAGAEPALVGTGTADYVPLWTPNGTTLGNSVLFQVGTGSTAKIGINTTNPSTTLGVNGAATIGGLTIPAAGTATAAAGTISHPLNLYSSVFNSSTKEAVNQTFRWQTEPTGNDTSSPSGTLNLLFGSGSSTPAETGLHVASNGQITFAPGQTFPGAGGGVSSVGLSAPSSDFTVSGSPVTSSGTLALNWTVAPDNADVANAIVKRDSNGGFMASSILSFGTSGGSAAIIGSDSSSDGVGAVQGMSGNGIGVYGSSSSTSDLSNNEGVYGTGPIGVSGSSSTEDGIGVFGTGVNVGVEAYGATGVFSVAGSGGTGLYGDGFIGVEGLSDSTSGGWGVYGESQGTGVGGGFYNTSTGDALFADNQTKGSYAAFFLGNIDVDGTLYKAGGAFKIDHPLDPANKYLYHSFVESPDMKNIYDGNVTTDGSGLATVTLPDWFEALNSDFRYQLTAIGQFAQAMVASEISDHQFTIKTDKPNVKVSWQVTGIRQDAWANANRIPVEVSKAPADQGLYLHPELFGAPAEKSIALAHHPMPPKPPKQGPMIQKLQEQQAAKLKALTK